MGVKVSKSLLVDIIDPLELLGPNFELDSSLGKVGVKFSLEISGIYHKVFMFFVLFSEIALKNIHFEVFFFNSLLQESQLLLVNIYEVVFGHFQFMMMLFFQLRDLSVNLLLVACHRVRFEVQQLLQILLRSVFLVQKFSLKPIQAILQPSVLFDELNVFLGEILFVLA